jgi:endo-1,4-beta-mannosidase
MSPVVQIQHKENFGLYVDLAFQNQSPTGGLITDLVLVINRQETPEDKYLLQSIGFRTIDQQGVYRYSEEQMPIFLRPTQWEARTVNFLYVNPEQFPISTGTYVAEVLIWVDYQYKARYCATCRFEISADMLNIYLDRRERGSTFLQPITVVGADVQRSKKITDQEYSGLKQ